ncbi:MAG: hypothetical protein R3F39_05460 [Myxococcota bacterium]
MKRNFGIWFLTVASILPLVWVGLTMPIAAGGRAMVLFAGALVTDAALLHLAWRAHRAGTLTPNHCRTCDHPMVHTRPGEIRPPSGSGTRTAIAWRCRHCGRLA